MWHVLSKYNREGNATFSERPTTVTTLEFRAQNKDLAQSGEMFPRSHKDDFYKDFDPPPGKIAT